MVRGRGRQPKNEEILSHSSWLINGIKISAVLLFLILLGSIIYGCWYGISNHRDYVLTEIEVIGNLKLTQEELVQTKVQYEGSMRALSELHGENLFRLPLGDIRKALEKIPLVDRVEVIRQFPGTLVVRITERRIIAIFNNKWAIDEKKKLGNIPNRDDFKLLPQLKAHFLENEELKSGDDLPKDLAEIMDMMVYINTNVEIPQLQKIRIKMMIYDCTMRLDPFVCLVLEKNRVFDDNARLYLPISRPKYTYKEALKKVAMIIDDCKDRKLIRELNASIPNNMNVKLKDVGQH